MTAADEEGANGLKEYKNMDDSDAGKSMQPRQQKHHGGAGTFGTKHDGRGFSFLKVLVRMQGSVVPRVLPVAFFSGCIAEILLIMKRFEVVDPKIMPILLHPIAVQMLAIVLGYCLVLRASISINRYFSGLTEMKFFSSKWADAYMQLTAFISSSMKMHIKAKKRKECEELCELQVTLLHWFSMLHGIAINCLQATQMGLEEEEYFRRLEVIRMPRHLNDFYDEQCTLLDYLEGNKGKRALKTGVSRLDRSLTASTSSANARDSSSPKSEGTSSSSVEGPETKVNSVGLNYLIVLGYLSADEFKTLRSAECKVDVMHSWIIEAVAQSSLEGRLLTQPPILSRVYQELSNGMLGFNQAYKIALVQFPFAFAQMLTLFLVAFLFACPTAVYVFTGGWILTPLLTSLTVGGFWGIHEIAVEIENPFGQEANHLPLVPMHTNLTDTLIEVTMAHLPKKLPD